ncbi:hypothetical protein HanIR_Chr01g0039301 [Helianthus annuus]|nr:hypothetical protein HanIR_Chr01g0039301 [Helianthus annuus]
MLYSSHPVIPQTKSPFLNFECPESRTLATPYPVIGCKMVKITSKHKLLVNSCPSNAC